MTTEIRHLGSGDDREIIREAAACLTNGGLVVFPTETVYGLGANAFNPQAIKRLYQVKERPATKPFTLHIGAPAAVGRFVPDLDPLGKRLIEKAWPGPLTIVFQVADVTHAPAIKEASAAFIPAMYHEGTIGIRCPDDPTASLLLTEAEVPVVAASANPAGIPAPVTAKQAAEVLNGQVDLVLDAGRTRYAMASTVVRVGMQGLELLREGVVEERIVRRLSRLTFLIVCSGNTCRSSMAEGLLRKLLAEKLGCPETQLAERGYQIESAGTSASNGLPATSQAIEIMRARNIDLTKHRSRSVTLEMLRRADYIFVMTSGHLDTMTRIAPEVQDHCRLLDVHGIEDPIGGDLSVYRHCADRMESALRRHLEDMSL